MKPLIKDGKFYRWRRGVLVEIPPEWLGQVTSPQTIRKRPSKQVRKLRRQARRKYPRSGHKMAPDLGDRRQNISDAIDESLD